MKDFNRNYKSKEEQNKRFGIFLNNMKTIRKLNSFNGASYGANQFTDLSPSEFKHMFLMKKFQQSDKSQGTVFQVDPEKVKDIPANYDWRNQSPNPVTPVKNQGQCGSCWAFSTTQEVESVWILAGKTKQILSEQQIVDCDTTDDGCDGGDTVTAYEYVISAGGLETEANYPYEAVDQTCQFKSSLIAASISSWSYATTTKNETQMQNVLYSTAPLSICVDASSWQYYTGGIIKSNCGQNLDHCVQITGYGTASDGTNFWWIRNSWGASWGQGGYLQVERNKNLCGVADEVTIAKV
eukprot:TRINITY_DN42_c0_g1_i1.p1 TRINITY_DN42_c0_g1~~TRINITY_DN42_c0_g1_i1.p1  ORF type:complete len:326 (+),score=102.00 TRINITY_DN42_c0_g1_i1:92-979(+)